MKLSQATDLLRAFQAASEALDYAQTRGVSACLCCGTGFEDVAEVRALLERRLERARELVNTISADPRSRLETRAQELRNALVGAVDPTIDASVVRAELDSMLRAKSDAEAAGLRRKAGLAAVAKLDAYKALGAAVDRMLASVLGTKIDMFAARARDIGIDLGVQLLDGSKPVCRLGLTTASGIRSWKALSGMERATFFVGAATALAQSVEADVKLLVIDETWLSQTNLEHLCSRIESAVAKGAFDQAIVCAVEVDPSWGAAAWKRINL